MGAKESEIVPLHAGFDVVYRGFHRRQVIEHLENLEEQLKYTTVDRAEALAQAADLRKLLEMTRRDLDEARARIERLEMSPHTTSGASERLHRMLVLAEDEANELRLRAERDVKALRERTEAELADLRREVGDELTAERAEADAHAREQREAANLRAAELDQREVDLERRRTEVEAHLKARVEQVDAECAAAIARAQEDADRLLRETAEECNRLESESDAKRAKAQNFFELTMTRRRKEAEQHFAEQEELAKARASFLIKLAAREAQRRIGEIRQQADDLRELRRTVATQLAAARVALDSAADRVPSLIPEQTGLEQTDLAQADLAQAGLGQADLAQTDLAQTSTDGQRVGA
jgi:chromosome segregation ATPase